MNVRSSGKRVVGVLLLTAVLVVLLIFAMTQRPVQTLDIEDAWIRAPVTSKSITAAYCKFTNHSNHKVEIRSAESNAIGSIEFHESRYVDEKHRMVLLSRLVIPAGGTLSLEPGGKHLMLFNLMDEEASVIEIEFMLSTGETLLHSFSVMNP